MRPSQKSKLGRAALTLIWLVLVVAWVFAKSPRFWAGSAEHASDAEYLRHAGQLIAARAEARLAADLRPTDAPAQVLLGGIAAQMGDMQEAERAFRKAARLDPTNVEACLGLAQVLINTGRRADAVVCLQSATPSSPTEERRRLGLLAQTGNTAVLAKVTDAILVRTPGDRIALSHALDAAEAEHRWRDAAELARRLSAASPENEQKPVILREARARELAGQRADALKLYSLIGGPETLEPRTRLAMESGEYSLAAELFTMWPEATLKRRDRLNQAYALQRSDRRDEALALYRTLYTSGQLNSEERITYAWLLNTARHYAEAYDALESVPSDDRRALEVRARTAAWAGHHDEAVELLSRWVRVAPRDAGAWALLAEAQRQRGDRAGQLIALRTLARLQPDQPTHAMNLASALMASDDVETAIANYRTLLADRPTDLELITALGRAYERAGRLSEALDMYEELDRHRGSCDADTVLRIARLNRWTMKPERAVDAYRRWLTCDPKDSERRAAIGEVGLALEEVGEWRASLPYLDAGIKETPDDTTLSVAAARASMQLARPARVVDYLQRVAGHRPLTVDESDWLAGALVEAGHRDRALDVYYTMADTQPSDRVWERIGDLENDADRVAASAAAYEQVPADRRTSELWRKLARTTARGGHTMSAASAYDRALALEPGSTDLALEAARFLTSHDMSARAIPLYEAHQLEWRSPALTLEVARTYLAAGAYDQAMVWARRSVAAGDSGRDARLVLAQSLHLSGDLENAEAVLTELRAQFPQDAEVLTWLARGALARGHHLAALRLYDGALASGASPSGPLWLERGDASFRLGDVNRAAANYSRAEVAGADRNAALQREQHILDLTLPQAVLPAMGMRDTNDLSVSALGGGLLVWPSVFGRLAAGWQTGRIDQGATNRVLQAFNLSLDRVYPSPALELAGQLRVEDDGTRTLPLGRLRVTRTHARGSSTFVEAFDETPWSRIVSNAPLEFNRIIRLSELGAGFHNWGARAGADMKIGKRQGVRADVSFSGYSDSNRQWSAYGHYQRTLVDRPGTWLAIQPNAYFEGWKDHHAAYFSPSHQSTLGVQLHGVLQHKSLSVDGELSPQWLADTDRQGTGLAGTLKIDQRVGPVSFGAGAMVFDDRRYGYRSTRLTAEIRIPIGRR